MVRENYNKLVIEAGASEGRTERRWRPTLSVERHDGDGVTTTEILVPGTYGSMEDAIDVALLSGRKWIDEGRSAADEFVQ